jgi:zinc finger protein 423
VRFLNQFFIVFETLTKLLNRCPACPESFHVEFLLDRHLQTHHAMNENFNAKYDKDAALSHLSIQKYQASFMDKNKFNLNKELTPPESAALLAGINPNIFSLNPLSSQYMKGLDLMTLHENLSRAQTSLDDSQRIKQMLSLQQQNGNTGDSIAANVTTKNFKESQNVSKSVISNDRNNNKSSSQTKEKMEINQQFDVQQDKPNNNPTTHITAKAGVSLKCAYCESRDDFKTR